MNAPRLHLLFLVFLFATVSSDGGVIPALQLAAGVVNTVLHVWGKVRDDGEFGLADIAGDLHKLQTEISGIDSVVKNTDAALYGLVSRFNKNTRLELQLNELGMLVSRVNTAKRLLTEYMKHPNKTERLTFEDFATWCVSQNPSAISGLLDRMHMITTPVSEPGLINPGVHAILLDILKETDTYMCDMQQSPNQLLYNMYNTILLTDIKGYTMMQFSWMILKMYEKGNFEVETAAAERRFEERINMTAAAAKMVISAASRDIRRCEPFHHVEGETFTSLTRLLQGYIENEVDLNDENTCKENCGYYQVAKNHGCFKEQFCSKQKACIGKILNCQFIESDMKICQSPSTSHRRYDWIEYESKGSPMYGKYKTCTATTKVESWWRWLFWHCSYCMCLCDQSGPSSDRYFSLRETLADVSSNKVVTGIRFTKQDRIIHVQICEGTLLPGGKIDPKSVAWKAIEPMELKFAKKYKDYHEMTNEERAIDLDDLEAPAEHVLTGIRFKMLGAHLNFEIQAMPFDFETGVLNPLKYLWISNDNTPVNLLNTRTEVIISNPDVPTNSWVLAQPKSKPNQFVKFTHTDFIKDAAQTTIPYLDTQPVISKIPIPLSGAGIFYKGSPGSGGYIAPKIITYDFSNHMESNVFKFIEENMSTEDEIVVQELTTESMVDYRVSDNTIGELGIAA